MSRAQQFLNPLVQSSPYTAYQQKVLGYSPIAYWPLDESSGSVARCLVNSDQNGAYTGVTLANAAGPDGVSQVPLFDGTNDYANVYTTTLRDAYPKDEGTLAIWIKTYDIGVWAEAAHRTSFLFQAPSPLNQWFVQKYSVANRYWWVRRDNTGSKNELGVITPTAAWVHVAMSWSVTNNKTLYYWAGSPFGTDDTADTATGTLSLAIIGAATLIPGTPWHGWLSDAQLYGAVLSDADIAALATV